jgi:hypothetical protein
MPKELILMIYICERKSCNFLFEADAPDTCPDCGYSKIRPANSKEQEEYRYFRQIYGSYDDNSSADQ